MEKEKVSPVFYKKTEPFIPAHDMDYRGIFLEVHFFVGINPC